METSEVTGIILAGGKSTRMGTDKAALPFGPVSMIGQVKTVLQVVLEKVIVVGRKKEDYSRIGLPVFEDIYPEAGPLGGLHAGLVHSSDSMNLVLSCDMPLMHPEFLRKLIHVADGKNYDIVLPQTSDGKYQPLCAVYLKSCAEAAERHLREQKLTMEALYRNPALRVRVITQKDIPFDDVFFTNINTPEEYASLRELKSNET